MQLLGGKFFPIDKNLIQKYHEPSAVRIGEE
jgi:hypothetical protein